MPNDPDEFNKFNGSNNSDANNDFVDSSFAVQFKPGDKTESVADKLKETKENIDKQESSINSAGGLSRFDFTADPLKDSFKDEFDDFEFDSSISAFKPLGNTSPADKPFETKPAAPAASAVPAAKPFESKPAPAAAPAVPASKPFESKPSAPVSTEPVFPKNGGTFDKPAITPKAPETSKETLPEFNNI